MNDNKHNDSSYPTTSTSLMNDNNSDLFTSTEKNQLNSFLDTFNSTNETHVNNLQTQYNSEEGNGNRSTDMPPSSPTPVLLSPPFSRNGTFGQQHIQTLPVPHDGQQQSMYRKQGTDNNNKREIDDMGTSLDMKKYRLMMDDNSTTSTLIPTSSHMNQSSSYSAFANNNAMEVASSSPLAATVTATPPPPKPKGSGRGRKNPSELLSDSQKKANHIASEQKRRANIRIGFDQLVDIVPNLNECQRSESLILHKSAEYIRQLVDTKNSLRDRVRELQIALGEVPDEDSSEGEMDFGF